MTRRARLLGELRKAEIAGAKRVQKAAERIAAIEKELQTAQDLHRYEMSMLLRTQDALQGDLASIDSVLRLHEVQIDPDLIQPICSHTNAAVSDYGHITRFIFECLRLSEGESRTTTQIATYAAMRVDPEMPQKVFSDFRYRIRKRLQRLTWEGKLQRLHAPKGHVEGRWQLADLSDQVSTRNSPSR